MSPLVGPELQHRAEQYATQKHTLGTVEWSIAYNGYIHGYIIQEVDREVASRPVKTLPSLPPLPGLPKL